ncbi:MAG: prolipoprotein diacylglyceryl transferase [Oscillospiraceae bacterium]|nr:prolipoprotein diacylglyceryl transferase [Oscillospiraceae bacterium]
MREAIISFPMLGPDFAVNPPYCIRIGGFEIYFYGILIALGMLLAVWYCTRVGARFRLTADEIYGYLIPAVICAVIGARLYYCILYTDAEGVHTYLRNPVSFLYIRDGGLALYGGVLGAGLAIWVRALRRRESVWRVLDIMGMGLPIGQAVGRWGNFFNREAYGYETDIFCRMGLTLNGTTVYVHPTFLYESLWNCVGFGLLHFLSKRIRRYQGQFFLLYLIWYGLGRTLIEGLRSDSLWLVPGVVRVSQLLAACTCVLALALYIINANRLSAGKAPLAGRRDPAEEPPEPQNQETVS